MISSNVAGVVDYYRGLAVLSALQAQTENTSFEYGCILISDTQKGTFSQTRTDKFGSLQNMQ